MINGGSMSTLNIKNFPDDLYQYLKARAETNHRSLAQEVTFLLRQEQQKPKVHSILELQGLGKEIWGGIDAAEYVRQERDSWD